MHLFSFKCTLNFILVILLLYPIRRTMFLAAQCGEKDRGQWIFRDNYPRLTVLLTLLPSPSSMLYAPLLSVCGSFPRGDTHKYLLCPMSISMAISSILLALLIIIMSNNVNFTCTVHSNNANTWFTSHSIESIEVVSWMSSISLPDVSHPHKSVA